MTGPFGYVRLFNRTGEAWHIVQDAPTADATSDAPTLCGYPPVRQAAGGKTWPIIVSGADWMKVCSRCERVKQKKEEAEPCPS